MSAVAASCASSTPCAVSGGAVGSVLASPPPQPAAHDRVSTSASMGASMGASVRLRAAAVVAGSGFGMAARSLGVDESTGRVCGRAAIRWRTRPLQSRRKREACTETAPAARAWRRNPLDLRGNSPSAPRRRRLRCRSPRARLPLRSVPAQDHRLQQRRKRRIALCKPVSVVVLAPHVPLELPFDPPDGVDQRRLDVHLPQPWSALEAPASLGPRPRRRSPPAPVPLEGRALAKRTPASPPRATVDPPGFGPLTRANTWSDET